MAAIAAAVDCPCDLRRGEESDWLELRVVSPRPIGTELLGVSRRSPDPRRRASSPPPPLPAVAPESRRAPGEPGSLPVCALAAEPRRGNASGESGLTGRIASTSLCAEAAVVRMRLRDERAGATGAAAPGEIKPPGEMRNSVLPPLVLLLPARPVIGRGAC